MSQIPNVNKVYIFIIKSFKNVFECLDTVKSLIEDSFE